MSDPAAGIAPPPPSLVQAAIQGDLAAVRRALRASPEAVRTRDEGIGSTPLHFAAHRGFAEIVRLLLDQGADPDAREGCSGTTALHWAAEAGHPVVVDALLEAGASLEPVDEWYRLRPVDWAAAVVHAPRLHRSRPQARERLERSGSAPGIFTAVTLGDRDAVRLAVAASRPSLHARMGPAADERTPLHAAVLADRADVVTDLLDLGADPSLTTSRGLTPAALALARGAADAHGLPAGADLPTALLRNDLAAASAALHSHPDALAENGLYGGLLHWTAEHGMTDATAWLIDQGASPDGESIYLCYDEWLGPLRPLHRAAHKGRADTVRLLLASGAERSPPGGRSGLTPLHLAAVEGHLPVVRILVEAGADVAARDTRHRATPLGWARYAERTQVASWLQEVGTA